MILRCWLLLFLVSFPVLITVCSFCLGENPHFSFVGELPEAELTPHFKGRHMSWAWVSQCFASSQWRWLVQE